ncbi:MAG: (2Fe-2S)-binding protein [Deltaproteobacteria bacterium]|nr:(2Fe-2S)-binding protein [Deltaproteobacteria bacterium]
MESVKQVELTINDRKMKVAAGTTVFQAADKAGIFIPHFCYHPDLTIAGCCRMCLVEIKGMPKLAISCNTPVSEGMVVQTESPKVKDAVKAVLELQLINHPLDCPICDKAGECRLQDNYARYDLQASRMQYEKGHKPKVMDLGPLVLDAERCVLCARCVRFTAEVTKTNELAIYNRGDRSTVGTYNNQPFTNHYTGNLADMCPVGGLTAKDFRFQMRVWFLQKVQSVCTLCARGCNTLVSVNQSRMQLYRIEPRRNPSVNKSWMCDTGRWDYHYVYDNSRIKTPVRHEDGRLVEKPWLEWLTETKEGVNRDPKGVLIAISTQATNEEIVDCVQGLRALGVENFCWIVDEAVVGETQPYDGVLRHRDLTANASGFLKLALGLQIERYHYADVKKLFEQGRLKQVLILGLEGKVGAWVSSFMAAIPRDVEVTVHATNVSPYFESARWWIPNVSSFEKSGTVVNALGRVQKLQAVIPPQHTARNIHEIVLGLAQGHDRISLPKAHAENLFEAHVSARLLGRPVNWRELDPLGENLASEGVA